MNQAIDDYNQNLPQNRSATADRLADIITGNLTFTESKIWHAHPVWFIDGNPIVGYNSLKTGLRLLFWSGQSFTAEGLQPEGSFKAAGKYYATPDEIDEQALIAWLKESEKIQWDYKNVVKRKGELVRL